MDSRPMMDMDVVLMPDDQARVQSVLEYQSARAHFQISLPRSLNKWLRFIHKVEQGYDDSIYDYRNDLDTRELLAEVEAVLSDTGRIELAGVLQPLDDRFRTATTDHLRSLSGPAASNANWWDYRLPKLLTKELKDDLLLEGLL